MVAGNLPLTNYSTYEIHDFTKTAHEKGIEIEVGTRGLDRENLLKYLEIMILADNLRTRVLINTQLMY